MKNIKLIFLIIFGFISNLLFSQGHANLRFGLTFPQGKFSDDDRDNYMFTTLGAGTGFHIGLDYDYRFEGSGLGAFGGVDFNYNPIKRSIRDDVEDELASFEDVTFQKYFNIPITGGLFYALDVNDNVSLMLRGGLNYNILIISPLEYINTEYEIEETINFSTTSKIGFRLGGGLIIEGKYLVHFNYFGLGKYNIPAEYAYDDEQNVLKWRIKTRINYLSIGVGIRF